MSKPCRILRRELPASLKPLPHADTLFRLLRDIDVAHLEQAHVDLVRRLIRAKTKRGYLIDHACPIAMDGSQKLARDTPWVCLRPARARAQPPQPPCGGL